MSDIDPQEFGRLQAQVETLIASDREKTELLKTLSDNVTAMRLEMAETMAQAKGGWKVLTAMVTASASVGGVITWMLTHLTGRGSP